MSGGERVQVPKSHQGSSLPFHRTPFVALLTCLVAGAVLVAPAAAQAAVPVLVLDGQGFGHGVGMAQDGAYWMGRAGASTEQILGHFYPGVTDGRAAGPVRVAVFDAGPGEVTITFPGGGELRSPRTGTQRPGFPIDVAPGASVRIRHDGAYKVVAPAPQPVRASAASAQIVLPLPTTTSTTWRSTPTFPGAPAPPPPSTSPSTTAPPTTAAPAQTTVERASDTSIWSVPRRDATIGLPARSARYRGDVEVLRRDGTLRVINELDVEQYLRGMGEVRDPSWPAASLRAQAIAARTYALRAMRAAGEICDSQRCQVYLGQQAEYGAMDAAVAATAGRVLTYGSGLAAAVYSANGAGVSATPNEGFGTPDSAYPYLRAAPYETQSPTPWSTRIALSDLAARLKYPGELTGVAVASSGPSGRPVVVTLSGSAGDRTVPGIDFTNSLALRSTKWVPRIELGEAPPPPPPAETGGVQVLPDSRPTRAPRRATTAPADDHDDDDRTLPIVIALVALGAAAVGSVVAVERRDPGETQRARPGGRARARSVLRRRKD
jgi:stage II sporulation protein D